jgi:hypothetical protein
MHELITYFYNLGFGRYIILGSGELLIRNVSKSDMGSYRCQTRHQLTNEVLTSSQAGRLIVTGKLIFVNQYPDLSYF